MEIMPHELYDAAIPVGTVFVSAIGLMIRSAILKSEERLGEKMNAIGGKIDVHVAEDVIIHNSADNRMFRIEKDVDKLEVAIEKLKG